VVLGQNSESLVLAVLADEPTRRLWEKAAQH
jgi:hypothetical protein